MNTSASAAESLVPNGDFETGQLEPWQLAQGGGTMRTTVDKAAACDGKWGVQLGGVGDGHANVLTEVKTGNGLRLKFDYSFETLQPTWRYSFQIYIQGFAGPEKKCHVLYWHGDPAPVGNSTQVPNEHQSFYTLNERLDSATYAEYTQERRDALTKRRWKLFNRDIGADMDLVHGVGTMARLGVDRWRVELILHNGGKQQDRDRMSVWLDNIALYDPPAPDTGLSVTRNESTLALNWPRGLRTLEWSRKDGGLQTINLNGTLVGAPEYGPALVIEGPGGVMYRAAEGGAELGTDPATHAYVIVNAWRSYVSGEDRIKVNTEYLVRKYDGLTLVSHRLEAESGSPRIQKLKIAWRVPALRDGIAPFDTMVYGRLWDTGIRIEEIPTSGDVEHLHDDYAYLMISNGQCGLELFPTDYLAGVPESPWRAFGAGGMQHVEFTAADHAEPVKLDKSVAFRYGMGFFPLKPYRPVEHAFMGDAFYEPEPKAKQGVNLTYRTTTGWSPYFLPLIPDNYRAQLERIHKVGMKYLVHLDTSYNQLAPNWGWRPPYRGNDDRVWADRLISEKLWPRANVDGVYRGHWGVAKGDNPDGSMGWRYCPMCINARRWRVMLAQQASELLGNYDIDGVFLDTAEVMSCRNVLHGCSEHFSYNAPGLIALTDYVMNWLDWVEHTTDKDMIFLPHVQNRICIQSIGTADLLLPGEGMQVEDGDWEYPKRSEDDIVWTSLFTGAQCVFLNCRATPKSYTDALSRCALVWRGMSGHNEAQRKTHEKLWEKYIKPLFDFKISGAEVHHSAHDRDFGDFATDKHGGCTVVIYRQPKNMLVVAVNTSLEKRRVSVTLNMSGLQRPESKFHVVIDGWSPSTVLPVYTLRDGKLELDEISLDGHDAVFFEVKPAS